MTEPTTPSALDVHVTGVVQGVGFRPFVFCLAEELGLTGAVANGADGVRIHAEGPPEALERFVERLATDAPRMARIEGIGAVAVPVEGMDAFHIGASEDRPDAMTLVSPDIATCPDCAAELMDPADRRYRYPFVNCTNCGPRFTIIDSIPYDRPATSMRGFPMCPECAAEYADPRDRRFHAQPDACFACGPRLYLRMLDGTPAGPFASDPRMPHASVATERKRSDAIVDEALVLIATGRILAVKGLGGYHLCCDASNETAVDELRRRKRRWGKPLAVMVPGVRYARALCHVDDREAEVLSGPEAPIVLLRRIADAPGLADGVADGLGELGVMLPYTPLQHLLLAGHGGPLVMTSGNLSDEPIAVDDDEAAERLAGIADAILMNDRPIVARYDDSVVRVVDGTVHPVRRARGFAPFPVALPPSLSGLAPVLATGAEQKSTLTLTTGSHAFVSQHLGDLENAETFDAWLETLERYRELFRIEPTAVAHDLHPEYLSTKWALSSGLQAVGVQHHHAHIAAVTASHGIDRPVLGIALDGTGFGTDGTIWGGEVLVADWRSFTRVAHLEAFPLPGGSAAIRRPARTAIGLLDHLGLSEHPGARVLLDAVPADETVLVRRLVGRGVNTPYTSSMGRLFDAVAALTGVATDARYEGEAAILLESALDASAPGAYSFTIDVAPDGTGTIALLRPIARMLDDLAAGVAASTVSVRFHRAVVGLLVDIARRWAPPGRMRHVALGGGVFMNRFMLEHALPALEAAGFTPLTSTDLPANDGAVSYGQAVVALARRADGLG